ncbi:SGNH/GDSL hydrolase family protein [bacterium]|nr:SGNH/GDSL hydrolase family protein [bacterium]
MHRLLTLLLLLAPLAADAAQAPAWWNKAWTCRKRVRVHLASAKPFTFQYKPVAEVGEDLVTAQVRFVSGKPIASAAAEIRVIDGGGNQLPCRAAGPDSQGRVTVLFPARNTVIGTLAEPIGKDTKEVTLSVGRDKAVAVGMRFYALSGATRVATLDVASVNAKTCRARVVAKGDFPTIAKGLRVQTDTLTDVDYWVYYGNAKPSGANAPWSPPSLPVTQYAWLITNGSVPKWEDKLVDLMEAGQQYFSKYQYPDIQYRSDSLGLSSESWYICAYESLIYCDVAGLYRFSLDTHGPSYLYVNGRFAARRAGFYMQTGQLEHRGKLPLEKGANRLVMFVGENGKRVRTRLGWQPPRATVFAQVPPSAFITRVPAHVTAFETVDEAPHVFFTFEPTPASLVTEDKQYYQYIQFTNASTFAADGVEWRWAFGDKSKSRERSPGRLYELPKGERTGSFDVALEAVADGKVVGSYKRTVPVQAHAADKLMLAADIVSFANIVYNDERTSIAVRLRNPAYSPMQVRTTARITPADGQAVTLVNRVITIGAENESFVVMPVDMKELPGKRATVRLDLQLGSRTLDTIEASIIPSPKDLSELQSKLGGLYDSEGRRIMICADLEDPDRHMEWVFIKYFHEEVYTKHVGSRTRVLVYGDRMANAVGPDETFTDYVRLMKKALEGKKLTFQFVERTEGLLPTVPDLIGFSKALDASDPLPDVIVISPGLADVEQAVGDRNFARSVDVMIDRVRATGKNIRIVVVTPPPYAGNVRLSQLYTRALVDVARRHHVPFLDLGTLFSEGAADWMRAYYAAADADGMYTLNPNERAHERIAAAILELVY